MNELRWIETSHQYESLAVSLRCVLSALGVERTYEELAATLGLGSAVVATSEDTLGWWNAYARDSILPEVAALYGLRVRALHPPGAALGLRHSPEFAQHFRDSYIPLIARALEHHQTVLAWRGWPPPRDRMWGLVTEVRREMVVGYTLWHNGQSLPLTGPARQVYVIEESRPPSDSSSPGDLYAHVVRQAIAQWDGAWATQAGVLTGAAAYDAWRRELQHPSTAFDRALPIHRQQIQAVRPLRSARRHLATWLRAIGAGLSGDAMQRAARWATACDRVAGLLAAYESPEAVKSLFAKADGIQQACETLRAVAQLEADVIEQLRASA